MRDPEPRLVPQEAPGPEDLLENVLPDVGVDGAERVVEEVVVAVGHDGPGQADPLLLPAAQVDALNNEENIRSSLVRTTVNTCNFGRDTNVKYATWTHGTLDLMEDFDVALQNPNIL